VARQQTWDTIDEHTAEDDKESFLHVITWLSARYLVTNLEGDKILDFLEQVYDLRWQHGSHLKLAYLTSGILTWSGAKAANLVVSGNAPMTVLLTDLRRLFAKRYQPADEDSVDALRRRPTVETSLPAVPVHQDVKAYDLLPLFEEALEDTRWPEADKAIDHLPRNVKRSPWRVYEKAASTTQSTSILAPSESSSVGSGSSKRRRSEVTAVDQQGAPPSKLPKRSQRSQEPGIAGSSRDG
jgi:hypothetical protein